MFQSDNRVGQSYGDISGMSRGCKWNQRNFKVAEYNMIGHK